ncbi:MAG TPA: formaldehyde-activating enzyme [Acidimicrobiales bacterium]|jgi:5,6,7,8-tetrahydromethanopterin hydro-lyase|nr:formaldehyde-activating enzyme [Acidimicrobiales bacterium]
MSTEFGESFVGEGPEAAHVNTVLGPVGGPVETAWVTALATPRAGHVPFVATVAPGTAVRPFTLFVNKATVEGERHAELTWGAAQAGVAAGVMEAVAEGTVAEAEATSLLLVAAVWVNPLAADADLVFSNNKAATLGALRAGRRGSPSVADALAARHHPHNAYYAT